MTTLIGILIVTVVAAVIISLVCVWIDARENKPFGAVCWTLFACYNTLFAVHLIRLLF